MNNDNILNICLVGCGGMASNYRHRYMQIQGARLYMVIDSNENTAKETARELGVEKWSTNFEDALSPEINIVDISTPNFLHKQQAVAALDAGKHVLLQKPIAPTVEDAEAIVKASRRNRKQAGMYMRMLDNPIYYDIKRIFDEGFLGKVSSVHCRGAHRGGLSMPEDNWRKSIKKTGGGSFIQLALHPVNMIQFLLKDRITQVAAFSKNMMCTNIGGDDVTSASCEFESGTQGVIESAYCADFNILAIYGSKGFVGVYNNSLVQIALDESFHGEVIHYNNAGSIDQINTGISFEALYKSDNPYDQHIAFVEAVIHGNPVPVPAEVGLYDVKVAKAVSKSAEEKRFINISEI